MFAPRVVFAEFPTVVAEEDHDGVLAEIEAVEFVEQLADLCVRVTDRGVVAMLELTREIVGDRSGRNAKIIAQLAAREDGVVGRVLCAKLVRRQFDFCGVIHVPVFLRRDERQVRLDKSDREEEWFGFLFHLLQGGDC